MPRLYVFVVTRNIQKISWDTWICLQLRRMYVMSILLRSRVGPVTVARVLIGTARRPIKIGAILTQENTGAVGITNPGIQALAIITLNKENTMRRLTMMAEFGIGLGDEQQLPLWEGYTLVADIQVSDVLRDALLAWNETYEKFDVTRETYPDDFVEVGQKLAKQVQEELGAGIAILYFNENSLQREAVK